MTSVDINQRLYDQPFKAFRIHLGDGSAIEIRNPGMVIVSDSSAILPVETGTDASGFPISKRWRTVALAHIVQFSDLDEHVFGKRKKRN